MDEYPSVQVVGAPGYEDFEGVLLIGGLHPDGWPFAVVGFEWNGKRDFVVVDRKYVKEI